MIKIAIVGAAGRMGRLLVKHVIEDPETELSGALEIPQSPLLGSDAGAVAGCAPCGVLITSDADEAVKGADVVIDFTFAVASRVLVPKAVAAGAAVVLGSTGLTAEDHALIDRLAADGARIVQAPNMSIGVNLLFALCSRTARLLGEDYDIEVVEMHHNQKKDAPSGTAERLGQILAEARGLDYNTAVRHGREGIVGARTKGEIGMHALRGGDVVGDHTVIFATGGERVELTHKASSRDTFAAGAVRAAKLLCGAPAGRYHMHDVLGLK
jgi:4-hydroxy-tetrahydrodipicolinate reductase